MIKEKAIEIVDFPATDYAPLIDYQGWRVAVLAFCENTTLEKIKTMQKHEETDEVFILVRGNCTLLLAGEEETPGAIELCKMEPQKAYNIKKGFWHNHILDEEGIVVIVENQDTNDDNSPVLPLKEEQLQQLLELVRS